MDYYEEKEFKKKADIWIGVLAVLWIIPAVLMEMLIAEKLGWQWDVPTIGKYVLIYLATSPFMVAIYYGIKMLLTEKNIDGGPI